MNTGSEIFRRLDSAREVGIDPDIGTPYRAEVLAVDLDAQTVDVGIPTPRGTRRRTFDAHEVGQWFVEGRLVIDPPPYRPRRAPRR